MESLAALGAEYLAPHPVVRWARQPTQYRYDTLVVDSKPYGLNQTWTINYTSWPDMIGIQYQLDQGSTGKPIHEWVDNVKLTMW